MKFEIKKFNGKNDFSLWCVKMHVFFSAITIIENAKGKECFAIKAIKQGKDLLEQTHGAIQLSLADEVLREVIEETTIVRLCFRL